MRRIALAAATALLLTATACGTDSTDDTTSPSSSSPTVDSKPSADDEAKDAHADDVTITKQGVEDHDTWGDGAYVVHYTITNSGSEAADYFAGIEFLDADGDVLGSTGVTADKLGAGKSKAADASPLPVEIENGKPADIDTARISEVDRTPVE